MEIIEEATGVFRTYKDHDGSLLYPWEIYLQLQDRNLLVERAADRESAQSAVIWWEKKIRELKKMEKRIDK